MVGTKADRSRQSVRKHKDERNPDERTQNLISIWRIPIVLDGERKSDCFAFPTLRALKTKTTILLTNPFYRFLEEAVLFPSMFAVYLYEKNWRRSSHSRDAIFLFWKANSGLPVGFSSVPPGDKTESTTRQMHTCSSCLSTTFLERVGAVLVFFTFSWWRYRAIFRLFGIIFPFS